MTYKELAKKHPRFVYKSCAHKSARGGVEFSAQFEATGGLVFEPTIFFPRVSRARLRALGDEVLRNLAFHLGLLEIPSYWKTICSPEIVIEAARVSPETKRFLRNIILQGLGEFFYVNKINFTKKNFLTISSTNTAPRLPSAFANDFRSRVLVPIGGGKDSVVTAELLKKEEASFGCFVLEPGRKLRAPRDVAKRAKAYEIIFAERSIDPRLLGLNRKGYLNGHTPFSAYLAMASLAAAILHDYQYITLSNEQSANEAHVTYRGRAINHQYSKSFAFEHMFHAYAKKYVARHARYFSFLRPIHELQVAGLFAHYPRYFRLFRSCNAGWKEDRWCGRCPKCLFTFLALYSFLGKQTLLDVFGKNLFEDKTLLPTLKELTGLSGHKPFECVGTYEENRIAVWLAIAMTPGGLPSLLKKAAKIVPKPNTGRIKRFFASFRDQHLIPPAYAPVLRNAVRKLASKQCLAFINRLAVPPPCM